MKTAARGEGFFRRSSEAEGVIAPISCPSPCGEAARNERDEDLFVPGLCAEGEEGSG